MITKNTLLMSQYELKHKLNCLVASREDLRRVMSPDDLDTYPVLDHLDDMIADMKHLID